MKPVVKEKGRATFGDIEAEKQKQRQALRDDIAAKKAKANLTQTEKLDIIIQQNDLIIDLLKMCRSRTRVRF